MLNTNYEFDELDDIDKWRFIALVMLELQRKKTIPNDVKWLRKKISNHKKPITLTLKMLHNFIEYVTEDGEPCNGSVTQNRVDKSRIEKKRIEEDNPDISSFFDYFLLKTKKQYKLNDERRSLIKQRLADGYTLDQLKQAVDNFVGDDWSGRADHMDLIYCIGKQKGKADNLEKWINKPVKTGIDKYILE